MSNPLVFVNGMDRALTIAAMITGSALVITLPWVQVPRVAWPVLLFLGWLLLSAAWSIQPSFTLAAWAQTAAVAFVAVVISANASARVVAAGLTLGGAGTSAASLYAFHARLPGGFYVTQFGEKVAGVGTNSNILAYTLALSLCGAFAFVPRSARARLAWLGAVCIIGYGLIVADSATGCLTMGALAVGAVLMAGYGPLNRRFLRTGARRAAAAAAVLATAVAAVAMITRVLGQDLLTFSDRTTLWSAAIAVARERPVLGFGYGAVWQHPWKPPLLNVVIGEIWDTSGTVLSHGHNSVVDLVVEVGVVGVVLMVAVMGVAGWRAATAARVSGTDQADRPIMVRLVVLGLLTLTLFGITEPMATIPVGWWTLVVLTDLPARPRTRAAVLPTWLGLSREQSGRFKQ